MSGRRGPDPVAHDGLAAPPRRATPSAGFAGLGQPPVRSRPRPRTPARCPGPSPTGRSSWRLWAIVVAPDRCRSTCSPRRSWRPSRTRASCSASSRPRPTRRSTRRSSSPTKVYDVYKAVPRDRAHVPDHRARPAASAAWSRSPGASARRRPRSSWWRRRGRSREIPGVRVIPMIPTPLPGGGDFPVDLVIASTAEPERLVEIANTARGQGVRERALPLRGLRPQVRPAPGRGGVRPRQAPLPGRRPEPGRAGPRDAPGRRLREPLQHPGAQLQGDPAAQAERAADARSSSPRSTSRARDGKLVPLSTFATLRDLHASPATSGASSS